MSKAETLGIIVLAALLIALGSLAARFLAAVYTILEVVVVACL